MRETRTRRERAIIYEINYKTKETIVKNNNNSINIQIKLTLILYPRLFEYLLKIYTIIKIHNQFEINLEKDFI